VCRGNNRFFWDICPRARGGFAHVARHSRRRTGGRPLGWSAAGRLANRAVIRPCLSGHPDDVFGPCCSGHAHVESVPGGGLENSSWTLPVTPMTLLSPVWRRSRREQATARPDCLSTCSAASPRLRLASSAPKQTPNRVHGSRTHANGRPMVSVQASPPPSFSSSIQTPPLTSSQRR
jgi:hypothetical protein